MAKRKPKAKAPVTLYTPTTWDQGASGPANQERLMTEAATDLDPDTGKETPNPNGIRRRRRESMVILLRRQGHITDAQANAALRLWMASRGSAERDPLAALNGHAPIRGDGDPLAARIDARREFLAMWHKVPQSSRPVMERVVLDDQPVWGTNPDTRARHIQRLRTGLDAIA